MLKWSAGFRSVKVMLFCPFTTKFVMSKGPKLIQRFAYAVKSPDPVRWFNPAGISTTRCPLTSTCNCPTPLSKSSASNALNVKRTFAVDVDTLNVTVVEWDRVPLVPVTVAR